MSYGNNALKKKNQLTVVQEPSNKKKGNKYFYRVSNHHELYKIGASFYADYANGMKSFAISSTGYPQSQQNSILGLASFFDHKEDLRIAIISDNLKEGVFKNIIANSVQKNLNLTDDVSCKALSFHDHFEFINLEEVLDLVMDEEVAGYDELITSLFDQYDVVFWDVPDLEKIKSNSERYFPVIMNFDSLSIIVAKALSNSKDIKEITEFFKGYGISLKGLLFENQGLKNKSTKVKSENDDKNNNDKKKKKWWRFF